MCPNDLIALWAGVRAKYKAIMESTPHNRSDTTGDPGIIIRISVDDIVFSFHFRVLNTLPGFIRFNR
jgi:hypothetical protein